MADRLSVKIITPERVVTVREADCVTLPAALGQIQILPGHVPMFSTVNPGQIDLKDGDKTTIYAIGAGYLEVVNNEISLLVDTAEGENEIDPKRAAALIAEAKDRLANLSPEATEERFAFESQLAAAQASIEVYKQTSHEEIERPSSFMKAIPAPDKQNKDK